MESIQSIRNRPVSAFCDSAIPLGEPAIPEDRSKLAQGGAPWASVTATPFQSPIFGQHQRRVRLVCSEGGRNPHGPDRQRVRTKHRSVLQSNRFLISGNASRLDASPVPGRVPSDECCGANACTFEQAQRGEGNDDPAE